MVRGGDEGSLSAPPSKKDQEAEAARQHEIRGGDGGVPPSAPPSEIKWEWKRRWQRAAR